MKVLKGTLQYDRKNAFIAKKILTGGAPSCWYRRGPESSIRDESWKMNGCLLAATHFSYLGSTAVKIKALELMLNS